MLHMNFVESQYLKHEAEFHRFNSDNNYVCKIFTVKFLSMAPLLSWKTGEKMFSMILSTSAVFGANADDQLYVV